jgi:hypothetical protein
VNSAAIGAAAAAEEDLGLPNQVRGLGTLPFLPEVSHSSDTFLYPLRNVEVEYLARCLGPLITGTIGS